jgi:hypothetical protein
MTITSKVLAPAFLALVSVVGLMACESASEPSSSSQTTVLLREGRSGRDNPGGDVNVTLTLPSHWKPIDGMAFHGDSPHGVIDARPDAAQIDYRIVDSETADSFRRIFGKSAVPEPIEGIAPSITYWDRPSNSEHLESPAFILEFIPGAPKHVEFKLVLEARDVSSEVTAAILEVIQSVRYSSELHSFDSPDIKVTPDPDWIELDATSFWSSEEVLFSVLTPPTWHFEPTGGLDSSPGEFIGTEFAIFYDYGHGSCLGDLFQHLRTDGEWPELEFWEEQVNDTTFVFHRPVDEQQDHRGRPGATGACVSNLRESESYGPNNKYGPGVGMEIGAYVETREKQELVLAIIRTILTPANNNRSAIAPQEEPVATVSPEGCYDRGYAGRIRDRTVDNGYFYLLVEAPEDPADWQRAVAETFCVRGGSWTPPGRITIVKVKYTLDQLESWYKLIRGRIWQVAGVYESSIREQDNRIQISVLTKVGKGKILAIAAENGIPQDAIFVETAPSQQADRVPPNLRSESGLELTLKFGEPVKVGTETIFDLVITNHSGVVVDFEYGPSMSPNVVVYDSSGTAIWQSRPPVVTAEGASATLLPAQSRTLTETWNGRDYNEDVVPAGEYQVRAFFDYNYHPELSTIAERLIISD